MVQTSEPNTSNGVVIGITPIGPTPNSVQAPIKLENAFLSKLILEDEDGLPMTLHEPLVYTSALLQRTLVVPAGFTTDLASIPQLLWNILPPIGKYDRAAVLHDFLYRVGGVTKAQADGVLKEVMEFRQVTLWKRWVIYAGVRTGGFVPWNRYRAHDTEHQPVTAPPPPA